MKNLFLVSLLVIANLYALPINAKEKGVKINGILAKNTTSIIVSAEGSSYLGENDTPTQARANALAQAKRNAAESVLTRISSNTIVKDSVVTEDIIIAKANADVTVLEQENLPTINNEYKVKIKAEVKIIDQKEKISKKELIDSEKPLRILAWTSKKSYKEGEKLDFNILANKSSYITIMYLNAEGEKLQIFPNEHWKDNYVTSGEEIKIPSDKMKNFDFEITEPFGNEKIIIYASSSKFENKGDKLENTKGVKIVNKEGFEEFSEAVIEIKTYK